VSEREKRLDRVLDGFIEAVSRGAQPDVEQILARHPDLREPLRRRFQGYLQYQSDLMKVAPPPARSPRSPSHEGRVLGDFRLIREIGSGGMGVVFEAEQISLGRTVALKLLPAYRSLDPRRVERFRREASATAGLNHPGIVPVHAVGEAGGAHYIAMDLVDGIGLDALLEMLEGRDASRILGMQAADLFTEAGHASKGEAGGVTVGSMEGFFGPEGVATYLTRVITLAMQAARALHQAHANGVVHRDVKPGNILVGKGGDAVLVDFGLAHQEGVDSLTATGEFLGSFHYVSPEQASLGAAPLDHRTDIYSLGVTLYELLSLRVPFQKGTHHTVIDQILTREPPPLKKVNPAVPRDLATIVAKAMDKDRDLRYGTADEMADDLLAFLEQRPIHARPTSVITRFVKLAKRNRTLVAGIAVVLALALIFGVGELIWWIGEEQRFGRQQMKLLQQETKLLEYRTDDLLRRVDPVVAGGSPELAYLDLLKAIRGLPESEEVQRRIIGYADTLRHKGLVHSASRLLQEVLAVEPSNDVAAAVHNVIGSCDFFELDIAAASDHWQAAAELAEPGSAASREACLNRELLRLVTPARLQILNLETETGASVRTAVQHVICADTDDDGIDEMLLCCYPNDQPQIVVCRWDEQGVLDLKPLRFNDDCGLELGKITWLDRQCGGSQGDAFFIVAFKRPKHPEREGLITRWRWDEPSQELVLCWSHECESAPGQLICGDFDGDSSDELFAVLINRRLLVIDEIESRDPAYIPVAFKDSEDEDIGGLVLADLEGDGRVEVLIATSGHHRFGLLQGRFENGAFVETSALGAGVLNGLTLLPSRGDLRAALIISRGTTPRRDDLDAKIDFRFDRAGLFRVACDSDGWQIEPIWNPPPAMGYWFAPHDPVVGKIDGGNGYFVEAFLNWRREFEESICRELVGGMILLAPTPRRAGGKVAVFTGYYSVATGELDGDDDSEIVLYNGAHINVLGVNRPCRVPPPSVIGSPGGGRQHCPLYGIDNAGVELIDAATALIDGREVVESLRSAVQGFVDGARFGLAHELLTGWQWREVTQLDAFACMRADLDSMNGRYDSAARAYSELLQSGPVGQAGLQMAGIPVEERCALVEQFRAGGRRLIEETFESDDGAGYFLGAGFGTLALESDREGRYGGRYERGRFLALRCNHEGGGHRKAVLLNSLNIRPCELWNGRQSFRLSFLVYVSSLPYGASFTALLAPTETALPRDSCRASNPLSNDRWKANFVTCILSHVRNSISQEGDRYYAYFSFPGGDAARAGRFSAEFVTDHWLRVEAEYIPKLENARMVIRHVDRDPGSDPVARCVATGVKPAKSASYALQFILTSELSPTAEEHVGLEVFIDEVRFEVFD